MGSYELLVRQGQRLGSRNRVAPFHAGAVKIILAEEVTKRINDVTG
jgi:hypothetical protein